MLIMAVHRFGLWLRGWMRSLGTSFRRRDDLADEYIAKVFQHFPFTEASQGWLRRHVKLQVEDARSLQGGGLFFPSEGRVLLRTAQFEAAIHELAHAWWHAHGAHREDELIAAVVRCAGESEARFARMATLAREYVLGSGDGRFRGFLLDRNHDEMFASLASGCMADIRLMPPYLRVFYDDLFELLPPDHPSPVTSAPHA